MKHFFSTVIFVLASFSQISSRDFKYIDFKDIAGKPINIDSIYAVKGDTVYGYVKCTSYSSRDSLAYSSFNVVPAFIDYSSLPNFLLNKIKNEDESYMSSLRKSSIDRITTEDYIKSFNAFTDSLQLAIAKQGMIDRLASFENPKVKLDPPTESHLHLHTYEYTYTDANGKKHTTTSIVTYDDENNTFDVNTFWSDGSISRSHSR